MVRDSAPQSELSQYENPYMSTIELKKILDGLIDKFDTKTMVDLGCGIGAQVNYLAEAYPQLKFIGLDYNKHLIEVAQRLTSHLSDQISFKEFDVLNPKDYPLLDSGGLALISVHALCCFKSFEPFFDSIIRFKPDFFVVNSLFTDGELEVLVHIRDLNSPKEDSDPDGDFNIFSKSRVATWLNSHGYYAHFLDFFPDRKITKPTPLVRGTYTIETEWSPYTQFSGPVHLPWSFLVATKKVKV